MGSEGCPWLSCKKNLFILWTFFGPCYISSKWRKKLTWTNCVYVRLPGIFCIWVVPNNTDSGLYLRICIPSSFPIPNNYELNLFLPGRFISMYPQHCPSRTVCTCWRWQRSTIIVWTMLGMKGYSIKIRNIQLQMAIDSNDLQCLSHESRCVAFSQCLYFRTIFALSRINFSVGTTKLNYLPENIVKSAAIVWNNYVWSLSDSKEVWITMEIICYIFSVPQLTWNVL